MDPTFKFYTGGQFRPNYPLGSDIFVAEPPAIGKDKTQITLTLERNTFFGPSDASFYVRATLKSGVTALSGKSVLFQAYIGGVWTTIDTETTDGSGIATTSPELTISATTQYRAKFATDSSYVGSTSSVKTVTYYELQEKVKRFYSGWSQAYLANDNQDAGETEAVQNVKVSDGSYNRRKSLIGFDESAVQSFLNDSLVDSIDKLTIGMTSYGKVGEHNALIGFHDYTSKPATWNDSRVDQNQFTVDVGFTGPATVETTDSTILSDFASGNNTGISFGPATSDSAVYAISVFGNGPGLLDPWLEFTVSKWVPA